MLTEEEERELAELMGDDWKDIVSSFSQGPSMFTCIVILELVIKSTSNICIWIGVCKDNSISLLVSNLNFYTLVHAELNIGSLSQTLRKITWNWFSVHNTG